MIRDITLGDAKQIADIYNYYIRNTFITFEEDALTEENMKVRIRTHTKNLPWIVCEDNNEILGYAYAAEWKTRSAYRFSVESTVYLKQDQQGRGLGTLLYQELLNRIKKSNIHIVLGGIALPNEASVALHEKFGFKKVAHLAEVGYKFEKWIDVGYWELQINS